MKKYVFMISLLVIILSGCGNDVVDDVGNDVVVETIINDGTFYGYDIIEYESYMQYNLYYKESRDSLITDMYYNDVKLPKDTTDNKYFIPLSIDDPAWESGTLKHAEDNIDIYFVTMTDNVFENPDKISMIADNKMLLMVAVDEENQMYTICRLVFTGLPIITINTKNEVRDVDYPIRTADSEAVMNLLDTDHTLFQSDILIHARGGSSRSFPKIGYKMNLVDENGDGVNMNLLNLRKDDDWVLIPMYSDESMIRDKLTYDLWSEFGATNNDYGIHNGPEAEYIELFINDKYWGLYMLVVQIDTKQQNLADDEILCKIESWEVPSVNSLKRAGSNESMESITIKKPDKIIQSTWDRIAELINVWFEMPRNEFVEEVENYVDIDNVIDYWILINVTKGKDNTWKNMYLTWKHNSDGTYTTLISPWDCDLNWGVFWQSQNSLLWEYTFYLSEEILDFRIGNNMLKYNAGDSINKLKARYSELRNSILKEENLFARIDELTSYTHNTGAWDRDLKRWQYGGHADDNNEYLKTFATAVFKHLDDYVNNLK